MIKTIALGIFLVLLLTAGFYQESLEVTTGGDFAVELSAQKLAEQLRCTQEEADKVIGTLQEVGITSADTISVSRAENGYITMTVTNGGSTYIVYMTKQFFIEEIRKKDQPKDKILYQIIY